MPEGSKIIKNGEETGTIEVVNIKGEDKKEAFIEWTKLLANLEDDVSGFKRVETGEDGTFKITGEIYLKE